MLAKAYNMLSFSKFIAFWFLKKMPSSSVDLARHANSAHHVRENSEFARLVISCEPSSVEADVLQAQAEARTKCFMWWVKALLWCMVIIIFLLMFLKWGLPFLFEKVLLTLSFDLVIYFFIICSFS